DLVRLHAEEAGHGDARVLDGVRGAPAVLVRERGRIAEVLAEVREHGLDHARIARGGGVMVEVDRRLHVFRIPLDPDATSGCKLGPCGKLASLRSVPAFPSARFTTTTRSGFCARPTARNRGTGSTTATTSCACSRS